MGAVDIAEVALAAGYQSHAAFAKAFKARYGLSPGEFRQMDCWEATRLLRETKLKIKDLS
jgi:AraC family transcriptional regulator